MLPPSQTPSSAFHPLPTTPPPPPLIAPFILAHHLYIYYGWNMSNSTCWGEKAMAEGSSIRALLSPHSKSPSGTLTDCGFIVLHRRDFTHDQQNLSMALWISSSGRLAYQGNQEYVQLLTNSFKCTIRSADTCGKDCLGRWRLQAHYDISRR